ADKSGPGADRPPAGQDQGRPEPGRRAGRGRGHAAASPPAGRQHQAAVRRQGAGAVRRAVTGALDARKSSERLLIGLSGLVLIVGLALALSLRQRVRKDFARAYQALTAEVEERTSAERALRASEE